MIGLAIGAILLSLAVPSMQSLLGDSEMTATSNELVYSLQTARSEAIKRATPVALCPSASALAAEPECGGSFLGGWIVFEDSDGNGSRDLTDEVILQTGARSPAFSIDPDTVFEERVYFGISGSSTNPVGVPLSGSIALDYDSGSEKRAVSIAANGRITTTTVSD
jgi:type IV fimbrial biogenesis protein FimT